MNKKIQNATPLDYNGIHFKSKLEVIAYRTLQEAGLNPQYEPCAYVLQAGFDTPNLYMRKTPKSSDLRQGIHLLPITYTPDIEVVCGDKVFVFEVKGFADAKFPLKKKMFFKWLLDNGKGNYSYFEVHSKRNVLQAIEIIRSLCQNV